MVRGPGGNGSQRAVRKGRRKEVWLGGGSLQGAGGAWRVMAEAGLGRSRGGVGVDGGACCRNVRVCACVRVRVHV